MPSSVCPGAHRVPIDDMIDPVRWTLLTSPKRDFGDGGGSSARGAPINKWIQCYMHCKEWVVEGPNPLHHHTHSPVGGAHANVHLKACVLPRQRE